MLPAIFFQNQTQIVSASSPGRLDVMGGIADYSGSLVLQMPISFQTSVSIAIRNDSNIRIYSTDTAEIFEISIEIIQNTDDYQELGKKIRLLPNGSWACYVLGCYAAVVFEKSVPLTGLDFYVQSDVPTGKGLSSSAALEVATLKALQKLFHIDFQGTELPTLAQKVENLVVGAPCGLMDQLASYFGKANCLLPIVCRPDAVKAPISIPQNIHFLAVDSGVRHAVSGASYGDVRTAAFMGKQIINTINPAIQCLCDVSVEDFEQKFKNQLPDTILGQTFLEKYGEISDSLSVIDPQKSYFVQTCTKHPIYENARVKAFADMISAMDELLLETNIAYREKQLSALGQLMYDSHQSYSDCGLGNAQTDIIVEATQKLGAKNGFFGAKITGGGSGGTVCILTYGQQNPNKIYKLEELVAQPTK